jgi:integrase
MQYLKQNPTSLVWTVRIQIPARLKEALGKGEFKKSLGVLSKPEAERRACTHIAQWTRELKNAEHRVNALGGSSSSDLSDIPTEARKEAHMASAQGANSEERQQGVEYEKQFFKEAAISCTLREQGKDYEYHLIDDEAELNQMLQTAINAGFVTRTSSYIDEYSKECLSHLTARSRNQHLSKLEKHFCKEFPYLSQWTVSQKQLQKWLSSYLLQESRPSHKTLSQYRNVGLHYLDWLTKKDYNSVEYTGSAVTLPSAKVLGPKTKRIAWDDDQLAHLWRELMNREKRDYQLEAVFLIGCYTGCRIDEICSLRVEDIKTSSDRQYLVVSKSKTEKGLNRKVPIHHQIEPLINRLMSESKDGYLIKSNASNKYGDRSTSIGKRFGRLKTSLGYGKTQVFHSVRRSFVGKFEANKVDEKLVADIVGHEIGTMTYGVYGSGSPVEILFESVDEVAYRALEEIGGFN